MEELRQTALAYYKDAPERVRQAVENLSQKLGRDAKDRVSRQNFLKHMKMDEDCAHMSTQSFFNVLKKKESEELDFIDVMTLFYIIYSGRQPFCNGDCKSFITGSYFTCVKCYDNSTETLNVCVACHLDSKYVHQHGKFLDNYILPEAKRRAALSLKLQQEAQSIMNKSKAPESGHSAGGSKDLKNELHQYCSFGSAAVTTSEASAFSPSPSHQPPTPEPSSSTSTAPEASNSPISNAPVAVNPKPKHRSSAAGKKAIKTAELARTCPGKYICNQYYFSVCHSLN